MQSPPLGDATYLVMKPDAVEKPSRRRRKSAVVKEPPGSPSPSDEETITGTNCSQLLVPFEVIYEGEAMPSLTEQTSVMSAEEVLERLSSHARGSLSPFLVESEGAWYPDLNTKQAQANLFLLKKAKFKRRTLGGTSNPVTETEVEIELHDAQAALRDLGRHHKLFTEKSESIAVGVLKVEVEYIDG